MLFHGSLSYMAQSVHDHHSSRAIGGNERSQCGNYKEADPGKHDEPLRADQVDAKRDSRGLARRVPGKTGMIDGVCYGIRENNADGRAHDANKTALGEKLLPYTLAANAHGARGADLTRAFDHTHAHSIGNGKQNHDGDNG